MKVLWKGKIVGNSFNTGDKFWGRSYIILKSDIGKVCYVYTGNKFVELLIEDQMVGYRLGQFVLTKRLGSGIHKNRDGK